MSLPRPTGWRILLEIIPDELIGVSRDIKKAGLIVAESIEEQEAKLRSTNSCVCKVIGMGPDCYKVRFETPLWCHTGDTVLIISHAGTKIRDPEYPEKLYRIVNDEDIIGVY